MDVLFDPIEDVVTIPAHGGETATIFLVIDGAPVIADMTSPIWDQAIDACTPRRPAPRKRTPRKTTTTRRAPVKKRGVGGARH